MDGIALLLFTAAIMFTLGYLAGKLSGTNQALDDIYETVKQRWPDKWAAYKQGINEGYEQGLRDGQENLA